MAATAKSKLHKQVANAIRGQLVRKGWDQAHLADHAAIGQSHLSRLLNQKQSPTLQMLEKIANALDVSVRDLLPP